MKKRLSLLAAILATGTLASPAIAADHYIRGDIGINWINDVPNGSSRAHMNSGVTGTAAIGSDYGIYRVEGEIGYLDSDIKRI